MLKILRFLGITILVYFIFLLLLITLQYIPISFDSAFLRVKQDEIQLVHYQITFFAHVYSSIFVIVIGLFQFSTALRKRKPNLHRWLGKIYVGIILFIAGPSGLVISIYANGGIIGQVSFTVLAILWLLFTYQGYRFARLGDFEKHRRFMLRSYALTLSAITLRLFKWGLVSFFELGPMDTYQIVAVLGWTFNLLVVEIYLRGRFQWRKRRWTQYSRSGNKKAL